MPYPALKILACTLAWTMPAVLLYLTSRRMQKSTVGPSIRRLVLVLLIPLAWCLGLGCAFLGQHYHSLAWFKQHARGQQTEEDLVALGDYPNVFATWVLAGWIPVAVGLALARHRSTREGLVA